MPYSPFPFLSMIPISLPSSSLLHGGTGCAFFFFSLCPFFPISFLLSWFGWLVGVLFFTCYFSGVVGILFFFFFPFYGFFLSELVEG